MMKQPEKYDALLLFFTDRMQIANITQWHENNMLAYKICSDRYNEHIALMTYYLKKIAMKVAVAMGGDRLFCAHISK